MNEEQKNELTQILIGIAQKGEQVTSDVYTILQEQSPQLVQEILNWEFYANLFYGGLWMLLFLGVLCWLIPFCYKIFKIDAKELSFAQDSKLDDRKFFSIIFVALDFLVLILSCSFFADAIKTYIAPRLYMLEYIKDFID